MNSCEKFFLSKEIVNYFEEIEYMSEENVVTSEMFESLLYLGGKIEWYIKELIPGLISEFCTLEDNIFCLLKNKQITENFVTDEILCWLNKIDMYSNPIIDNDNIVDHIYEIELVNSGYSRIYPNYNVAQLEIERFIKESRKNDFDILCDIINKERKTVTRQEFYKSIPNCTDKMIYDVVKKGKALNYDREYFSTMYVDISDEVKLQISHIIDDFVNDGIGFVDDIYESLKEVHIVHISLLHNFVDNSYKLFSLLRYLFDDKYNFSRPYIAKIGTKILTQKERLVEFVREKEIIDIKDLIDFRDRNVHKPFSIPDFVNSLFPEYVFINREKLGQSKFIGLTQDIIYDTVNKIKKELNEKKCTAIRDLECINSLRKIDVLWDEWLLYSIIKNSCNEILVALDINDYRYGLPIISLSKEFLDENIEAIKWKYSGQKRDTNAIATPIIGDDFIDIEIQRLIESDELDSLIMQELEDINGL